MRASTFGSRLRFLACGLALLCVTAPATAQEPCPCGPEAKVPEPLWKAEIGLSYLATTGNTETTTVGGDVTVDRQPEPWGVEIRGSYDRAEESNTLRSERTFAALRGKRALGERWELFGEAMGARDRFAGFDRRLVLTAGGTWRALPGPRQSLDVDLGLSWTDEGRVAPAADASYAGAQVGLKYRWKISETSELGQRLTWFPDFETSSDWRLESSTSLEASLTERLALRLSYEVRHRNQPVGDRTATDTTTRMSVVLNL